jgi:myo-inositol 2-dehydrogenase/D-chiro-inositol 1-dehydrogenase
MNRDTEPLKLAFIGCGYATEVLHLPALQQLPDIRVMALSDLDPARLHAVGDRFRIERRATDYGAILKDPKIEAVAVCVPPQFHLSVARDALAAGKHLFIEKPLALDLDEIDRFIEQAARSDRKVMVGHNLRHHCQAAAAREFIRQGKLGQIEFIRSMSSSSDRPPGAFPEWRKHRVHGGGALLDLAVHHFDLWRFLLGAEFEELSATARSAEWDDMTAAVSARLTNGALATGAFSQVAAISNTVDIFGSSGRLSVSFYRFDGLEFAPASALPGDLRNRVRRLMETARQLPQAITVARSGGQYLQSYRSQWRRFAESVRHDKPVDATLEDGRRSVQAVLAGLLAARVGRAVKLTEAPRGVTALPPAGGDG